MPDSTRIQPSGNAYPAFDLIKGRDYSTLSEAEKDHFHAELNKQMGVRMRKVFNPLMDEYRQTVKDHDSDGPPERGNKHDK